MGISYQYKVDGNIEKGANKIKRTNNVILEKDYMSLCPNFFFYTNEFLNNFLLQIVIINDYNCSST